MLTASQSQYQEVLERGSFELNLAAKSLCISYLDEQDGSKPKLSGDTLVDFEHRLGFVQLDEKAMGLGIPQFLESILARRKALDLMCELRSLGHPDYQQSEVTLFKVGDNPTTVSVTSLGTQLAKWKQRLHEVSQDFPLLRVSSAAETQVLDTLIK